MISLLSLMVLTLSLCGAMSLSIHDLIKLPVDQSRMSSVRVPIKKLVQPGKLKDLVASDKARAKALVERATRVNADAALQVVDIGITANTAMKYVASLDIGSPPTTYDLIVDTGSANTWVGATTPFTFTSTTQNLSKAVGVQYRSGSFQGFEVLDRLGFGGPLTIPRQSIGIATASSGFSGVDGVLGIGPASLATGTVQGQGLVPTVTDNLVALGIITAPVVSAFFPPIISAPFAPFDIIGELVFGGIDSSAFIGNLSVFPVTTTVPASLSFGVDATFSQGGNTTLFLSSTGIIDSGTTLVLLASDAFAAYAAATGAVADLETGLLRVTSAQFAVMATLNVDIGGMTFPLIPDAQRWPQQLNTAIGGSPDSVYLIVGNLGSDAGIGFDFILGQFFLERFYSVFDTSGFVGLAPTVFTAAIFNN